MPDDAYRLLNCEPSEWLVRRRGVTSLRWYAGGSGLGVGRGLKEKAIDKQQTGPVDKENVGEGTNKKQRV